MEQYFNINYEFDINTVHNRIEEQLRQGTPGYICVADGNILCMVHRDKEYRNIINNSIFSICDSSWVPIFLKWLYGKQPPHYCGSDIFIDLIRKHKHRMIFLGTSQTTLNALRENLAKENPAITDMTFLELPYCTVHEFDYPSIARQINDDNADIIWIALGAPKQEIFMNKLQPHLKKGVAIAVGAVFNFYSGLSDAPQRCPRWMRRLHLEFLHRIFKEPRKQINRCWGIITTLPQILNAERHRK